jgi:hypothetical protein
MTPNSDGPDISRWNPVADWDAIPANPYRLFITKATGTSAAGVHVFTDPTFDANWEQMRRRNFEFRGCYHWLRSDWPMADQVEHLRTVLDAHGGLQHGEFVMLDWETTPNTPHPTATQVTEWLRYAEQYWPGRLAVYCSDWVPGFAEWRHKHPNYPLIYANYNLTDPVNGGWPECVKWNADVWQWSSSQPVPGIDDPTCDMNHVIRWATLEAITGGAVLYPDGYASKMITLEEMRAKHEPKMHPEFKRRFFAYIAAHGGTMGVGGGWRSASAISAASAAGKSFHQDQTYASGFTGYAAVDLVHVADGKHRAPTWAETADAPTWGLHTFIKKPNEPWHIQCIEMRGFDTWNRAGRPDPQYFELPGTPTPPTPPTPKADIDMIAVDYKPNTPEWIALMATGSQLAWIFDGHADGVYRVAGVGRVTIGPEQLTGMIKSSQTTTAPPPGLSAGDLALWNANRA